MTISRRTLLVAALALAAVPARADPFADALGQRRLVLVFDDSASSDRLNRQLALLATPKFGARGFDLVEVVGEGPVRVNRRPLATPTAEELRRRYRIGEGFGVRVIGMDGEVELATRQLVTMDDLEALLAAAPIRQEETGARGATP